MAMSVLMVQTREMDDLRPWLPRLIRAGMLTAAVDGLFSSTLSVAFYHSTVQRLFQGVAATLLGPGALNGGVRTAIIGVLMHIGVAFAWSAFFLFLVVRWRRIHHAIAGWPGVFGVAALYGPFVWLVMSLVVIPVFAHRPPAITPRWVIQLLGHAPFVGLPIVASIGRPRGGRERASRPPGV